MARELGMGVMEEGLQVVARWEAPPEECTVAAMGVERLAVVA